jgi:hypothetical protein
VRLHKCQCREAVSVVGPLWVDSGGKTTANSKIGIVLGHRQLSTTTLYARHAPQRQAETATATTPACNLPPGPEEVEDR